MRHLLPLLALCLGGLSGCGSSVPPSAGRVESARAATSSSATARAVASAAPAAGLAVVHPEGTASATETSARPEALPGKLQPKHGPSLERSAVPPAFRLPLVTKGGADRYGDPLPPGATMRLGSLRARIISPGSNVQLRFVGDGLQALARIRFSPAVRDVLRGVTLKTIGGTGSGASFALSPDLTRVAEGCRRVVVRNLESKGRVVLSIPKPPPAPGGGMVIGKGYYTRHCTAFDGSGARIVTVMGRGDGTHLWDAVSGAKLRSFPANCSTRSVAMSTDGKRFVCASRGGAEMWLTAGKLERRFRRKAVRAVAFSADDRLVAWADRKTLVVHDVVSGEVLGSLVLPASPQAIAIHDSGQWVAAAIQGRVQIWQLASGRPIPTPAGHEQRVTAARFSPDGRHVYSSGYDGTLRSWDAATGEALRVYQRAVNRIEGLGISRDGGTLATLSWLPGSLMRYRVSFFDSASGRSLKVRDAPGRAWSLGLLPDGSGALVGTRGRVVSHALRDGVAELALSSRAKGYAHRSVLSPDGKFVVSGHQHAGATAYLAPLDGGKGVDLSVPLPSRRRYRRTRKPGSLISEPRRLAQPNGMQAEHAAGLNAAAFSRDGKRLATVERSGRGLHMWRVPDGKWLGCTEGYGISAIAFDATGRRLVIARAAEVATLSSRLSPARDGKCQPSKVRKIGRHLGTVNDLDVSRDGRRVVSASSDGTLLIWRL